MKAKDIKYNDFWGGAQQVIQEAVRSAIAAAGDTLPEEVLHLVAYLAFAINNCLDNEPWPSLT